MSKVLITGDAGFIGFHLASLLLSRGHSVVGIDGMTDYYDPQLKRSRLAQLSKEQEYMHVDLMLEESAALAEFVATEDPDVIVHLAAQAGVRYSLENPQSYLSSNIVGTFNLLEAVRRTPVRHLLIASTSSVYGGNQKMPFAEIDRADSPMSLYAATKKSTEMLAHSYSHLFEIPTTCFRFFTVYGPWGRPDMALFKFVSAIFASEAIEVYGYGKQVRDFTYVADLVSAIDKLIECIPEVGRPVSSSDSLSAVAPFRSVNIAGGSPTALMDFISAVERAVGTRAELTFVPMQPGDVPATHADVTLLRDLIGAIPSTDVDEGVTAFVRWWRDYYGVTA